ncbi:Proton pump interactor 1 isoform 3 [Theobroma cacao]|uniref:Proton pump interactor 1 isoform 3 n=1 Tax=Theobroma cacao TaxID=3641 RepID=A0A061F806_THECC|nr:Proton pump interactor 1 isoform 3 [Theobroma cacao]
MGVEVVGSDMAQVSVDKVAEVEKSFLHDKENGKLDKDPVHDEPIKLGSLGEEPDKGEEINASDANFPKDAVDEWPAPKQIHSFYFVRYRPYDDPKIKAKIDQADKEIQKWNKARFQLTEDLKVKRSDRAELLSQVKALNIDFEQFKAILGEKKKEMEPLQQALGKLRNNNNAGGRGGICSSEEELNDIIHSLQYRIQHESIPLSEEKQLLREIKQLEGTREKVIANAAMRAKIQDSLGQKEAIQDQVKKFMALWRGKKAFRDDYEKRILPSLDSRQMSRDGRIRNPDEKPLVVPEAPLPSETETIPKAVVKQPKEEIKSSPQPDIKLTKKVQKDAETKVMESKSSAENGIVAEKEISGSGKLQKDTSADKEVDAAKLKEMKREEEIAKAKQAMERKKKLAEKAAAKAAIRAQKEAEKKLKEIMSVKRKLRRRRQHLQLLQILRNKLKM